MTTDHLPQARHAQRQPSAGVEVVINGFCKGAGMIQPDMATMLCFVFTDAPIEAPALHELVAGSVDSTFNCVTIDGDTSTSDTLLVLRDRRSGKARRPAHRRCQPTRLSPASPRALHDLLRELAILVAKDGEGITKFVTIEVEGAEDDRAARRIGLSIGNSPLVKTAIAGEDANWGRVRHGGRQNRARRPTATSCRSASGDILVASGGRARAELCGGGGRSATCASRTSSCASISASARDGRRSGRAT
ncbi:MAG: bifunctional ornithine acetyltransferase/N-acetylglutamate synthase, partial [Hyphomicrobium sp.]